MSLYQFNTIKYLYLLTLLSKKQFIERTQSFKSPQFTKVSFTIQAIEGVITLSGKNVDLAIGGYSFTSIRLKPTLKNQKTARNF
ncbi:hypothetical protein BWI92_18900 [Flectobacillus sp. BAB-3569]|nr:hypothetical protein BWI92_18900 [Flectobacillus sp. BAB-3569]